MSDESYWWDRTGRPDAELQTWERELAPFRYAKRTSKPRWQYAVAAAAVLLMLATVWMMRRTDTMVVVVRMEGDLTIAGRPGRAGTVVPQGQRLETQAGGRALLRLGTLGEVELVDEVALVVAPAKAGRITLRLAKGELRARIAADPYAFRVETPGAVVDDMGCAYQVVTDPAGNGWLRVSEGWVRLQSNGIESLVVEGTEAALRTQTGPGVPYRKDIDPALRRVAEAITDGQTPDGLALSEALRQAQRADAPTLLNLLWRAPEPHAELIFKALAAQHPPPSSVRWERFQAGDLTAVAEWWPKLGFRKTVKLPPAFYAN